MSNSSETTNKVAMNEQKNVSSLKDDTIKNTSKADAKAKLNASIKQMNDMIYSNPSLTNDEIVNLCYPAFFEACNSWKNV